MDVAFKAAYKNGYRLFDSAQLYKNEDLLGNSIKKNLVLIEKTFFLSPLKYQKLSKDTIQHYVQSMNP